MTVRVKAVGRELLYICFGEASGLGISQPLRQVQEGLNMGRGVSAVPRAGGPQAPPPSMDAKDLIVLHLYIVHI